MTDTEARSESLWDEFRRTLKIPAFPGRGLYLHLDSSWNPIGYRPEPQYKGQMPTLCPPEWSPAQCFLAKGFPPSD